MDLENPLQLQEPAVSASSQNSLESLLQSIDAGKTVKGAPQTRQEAIQQAIDREKAHPTYGVDWADVIRAHDEVMAYIEMSESFSGQISEARERRSDATRRVYHYIHTHDGQTPSLRDMNAIMREV